jgi:hypothetical protein
MPHPTYVWNNDKQIIRKESIPLFSDLSYPYNVHNKHTITDKTANGKEIRPSAERF